MLESEIFRLAMEGANIRFGYKGFFGQDGGYNRLMVSINHRKGEEVIREDGSYYDQCFKDGEQLVKHQLENAKNAENK